MNQDKNANRSTDFLAQQSVSGNTSGGGARLQLRLSLSSAHKEDDPSIYQKRSLISSEASSKSNEIDNDSGLTSRSQKIPRYTPQLSKSKNNACRSSSVNDLHLHHQISFLRLTYLNSRWAYEGTTTFYLTYAPEQLSSSSVGKTSSSVKNNSVADRTKELSFHFRGGSSMKVINVQVATIQPESVTTGDDLTHTPIVSNIPTVNVTLVDPLSKVLTKPCQSFTPHDFVPTGYPDAAGVPSNERILSQINNPPICDKHASSPSIQKRYEADTQSSRGGAGMMDSLRSKAIASNSGELKVTIVLPSEKINFSGSNDQKICNDADQWRRSVEKCWREDLNECSYGVSPNKRIDDDSSLYLARLKDKLDGRGAKRKERRLALVCKRLAKASCGCGDSTDPKVIRESRESKHDNNRDGENIKTEGKKTALKVSIRYRLLAINQSAVHLGGIHFHSCQNMSSNRIISSATPHVYTTSGIIGDFQGPRCWIPTIDSGKLQHRCSHEINIFVTAKREEGLWAAGCGEDFGVNDVVLHPLPPRDDKVTENVIEDDFEGLRNILNETMGKRQIAFISESLRSKDMCYTQPNQVIQRPYLDSDFPHPVPPEFPSFVGVKNNLESIGPVLATAIWMSAIWAPMPSRSLGFAVAPFQTIYDPEYFCGPEEASIDRNSGKGNVEKIRAPALEKGEGIRQLYFALRKERPFIHSNVKAILLADDECLRFKLFQTSNNAKVIGKDLASDKNALECVIIASTTGVPSRALELMRAVLAIPRFRSACYTQIWIPRAVDGGSSTGAFHTHPEITCNPYLGGAIIDSFLLHSPGKQLPYYCGGRALQLLQAQSAFRGWITAALSLGGSDDVGNSYILTIFECLIMSLYERAHGAFGEGGGKPSFYISDRYSVKSGLNSPALDFLPINNFEDEDTFRGAGTMSNLSAEDHNEHLWRSSANGTESHTSALDEFSIRQLIVKDVLEGLERMDKGTPSMGWLGSRLSTSFLSSNSTSASAVGCGAIELVHPNGGIVYRYVKCRSLRRIIEGRAGICNFIRVIRATFIAALLQDQGSPTVNLSEDKASMISTGDDITDSRSKHPFLVCIDDLLEEGGITHELFARSLRIISGSVREPYLRGTLIDISKNVNEEQQNRQLDPEGFPNSFIRGASGLYLRVGALVEPACANEPLSLGSTAAIKGIHLQVIVEPVIPTGSIAFGGPVILRVIENEGQCREFVRTIRSDGSRSDWGPIFLHAKPVTTEKQQKAASGMIESSASGAKKTDSEDLSNSFVSSSANVSPFKLGSVTQGECGISSNQLHNGGYQALELVRLTNRTPLLWIRVDPNGLYDGRYSIFVPDACLGEQLFHDGDAASQVEASRALAERPLRVQGSVHITSVYDVPVSELPVRLLGDCLRGSVALHADLPHNPSIRAQAALCIAQWQNNKAPVSKDAVGFNAWVGINLLIQYFNERCCREGCVIPMKYSRICVKKGASKDANQSNVVSEDDDYLYLDSLTDNYDQESLFDDDIHLEVEEDEEYRVRSAVVRAIACCRAKDGQTPPIVLRFLEKILTGNIPSTVKGLSIEEEALIRKKNIDKGNEEGQKIVDDVYLCTTYINLSLVAEALLALCYINVCSDFVDDPISGKRSASQSPHPCAELVESCYNWLEWDLYRETRRQESEYELGSGVGGFGLSIVSTCAITALCSLAILIQSTSDISDVVSETTQISPSNESTSDRRKHTYLTIIHEVSSLTFYTDILFKYLVVSDHISAAAASAVVCICCAADRLELGIKEPVGLLTALEILLDCILEPSLSPAFRHTVASLMMDACTGKACSTQRVAVACLENDFLQSASRFFCGPLGASYGGDNGSAIFLSVSEQSSPAANAVNDGARRGLRLLGRAGQNHDMNDRVVVRVARFATKLWRTINGELGGKTSLDQSADFIPVTGTVDGICAFDGHLRCALLALWQWIWPKGCFAILRVQSWKEHEGCERYKEIGADLVMKITDEEKEGADLEETLCSDVRNIVATEIDRQQLRGNMALAAFELYRQTETSVKDSGVSQGLNQPLGIIERDNAWKLGGWSASASMQRRAKGADGGTVVTKIRLIAKTGD